MSLLTKFRTGTGDEISLHRSIADGTLHAMQHQALPTSTSRSHRVFSVVVVISLVVVTAVVFAAMSHATNHMLVTM